MYINYMCVSFSLKLNHPVVGVIGTGGIKESRYSICKSYKIYINGVERLSDFFSRNLRDYCLFSVGITLSCV